MKPIHLLTLTLLPCLLASCKRETGSTGSVAANPTGASEESLFADALAKANAQCPQEYPEIVTPLPDSHNFGTFKTAELIGMLESWNPALREQASKALADRGTAVLPELRQGTHSGNTKVRAGSASAMASILKSLPPEQQPADITGDFIRLTTDEVLEVRVAALQALDAVAPQTTEAVMAVLALCDDPDDYLAQDAKITLEKRFAPQTLPIDEITPGLKKAMQGSLPRGRGHVTKIIEKLKPEDRRRFIPELIAHLDWKPRRDTMFAAGGQAESVKLLTQMKETALVERLPGLMAKNRGPGFDTCVDAAKAFGADAKPILPELKAILNDIETKGKEAKIQLNPRDAEVSLRKLRETIQHLESL